MAEFDDLKKALEDLLYNKFSPKPTFTRGILGDGQGNVTVPERPDKSYVRFNRGANEFFEVFNRTVNPVEGWPVLIGELPWQPGLTQVVDTDWSAVAQSGGGDNLGDTSPHAPTHEWPDGSPGSDPVNVYTRSIVPLRGYANNSGTSVFVNAYEYEYYGSGHVWGGTPSIDLSPVISSMPSGTMRFMGVYLNPATNLLGVVTGSTAVFTSAFDPPRVQFPANVLPSARVRVYGSQANVTEFDMRDARQPWGVANWTTAGGDLTGTYPNPQVSGLFGYPLENGAPTEGDIWMFSGSAWIHLPLSATGGNVWPKAGESGISDTPYTNIDNFFDVLANGDQGIIGEGSFTTDWTGGHAAIPTGADVKGSGIDVTVLTDADSNVIEIEGVSIVEDLTVTNTTTTGAKAILQDTAANGYYSRVKAISTASSGTTTGFYIFDGDAVLVNCEAEAAGGATNRALYAYDAGTGTTVEVRGGYFDGDVIADQAGTTIHLDGPTITGSVTEQNSGVITGWYYDSNGSLIQYDSTPDVYPQGDAFGLMSRINIGRTINYGFNDSSEASAITWAGAPFSGAPTVNVTNSLLLPYSATAGNRYFGYFAVSGASSDITLIVRMYKRSIGTLFSGIRYDDGTDNNYVELGLYNNSSFSSTSMPRVYQVTGGGGVVTTDYPNYIIRGEHVYLSLYYSNSTGKGTKYVAVNPYFFLDILNSASLGWSPSRAGVYFTGSAGSNYIVGYDNLVI